MKQELRRIQVAAFATAYGWQKANDGVEWEALRKSDKVTGGEFTITCAEAPCHPLSLDQPVYLGRYEASGDQTWNIWCRRLTDALKYVQSVFNI